jgi:hypothetical protein
MAGLLQEIEREAADGKGSVGSLLRKCQILAVRLGNADFRDWTGHELNGYPAGSELPSYRRGLRTILLGDFANLAWRASRFALPTSGLPDEVRDLIDTQDMAEGVAELEELLTTTKNGAIKLYVDQTLWQWLPSMDGAQTLNIWRELSTNQVVGVLDQIRNRALAFALEVERMDPRAGDSPSVAPSVAPDVLGQVFNAVVMGQNVQYAPASVGATQADIVVTRGDLDNLRARLKQLGVTDRELDELSTSIKEDGKPKDGTPGPRVSGWIGRVAVRVASAVGGVGGQTAAGVLAVEIARFLGA